MTFFQMHLQNKKLCDYDDNNNNNNNIIQWTCFWRFILQLSEYDTVTNGAGPRAVGTERGRWSKW